MDCPAVAAAWLQSHDWCAPPTCQLTELIAQDDAHFNVDLILYSHSRQRAVRSAACCELFAGILHTTAQLSVDNVAPLAGPAQHPCCRLQPGQSVLPQDKQQTTTAAAAACSGCQTGMLCSARCWRRACWWLRGAWQRGCGYDGGTAPSGELWISVPPLLGCTMPRQQQSSHTKGAAPLRVCLPKQTDIYYETSAQVQHVCTCRYDVFPDIVPVADYADFGRQQLSNAHVPPSPMLRSGL
jgi:hypothetical protein